MNFSKNIKCNSDERGVDFGSTSFSVIMVAILVIIYVFSALNC